MAADPKVKYNRILLKLSGEVLAGEQKFGIESRAFDYVCSQIKEIYDLGPQIAIVIGGGNIFRGLNAVKNGLERANADHMGMLATMINALAIRDKLESLNIPARVLSAIKIEPYEMYSRDQAIDHLKNGRVVLLAAGTGRPYFSTDTAASLRAAELDTEVIIKATKVDGVYAEDPVKNPEAEFFPRLSFKDVIDRDLRVMDQTAVTMCRENNIPIAVFNMHTPGNLKKVVTGEKIGTLIS